MSWLIATIAGVIGWAACYSPDLKSCIAACRSNGDCAPGQVCLQGEGLCIDRDHPADECRGDTEDTPPVLHYWFGDPVVQDTAVDRSGAMTPVLIEETVTDPSGGDNPVLAPDSRQELGNLPHLEVESEYTLTAWVFVGEVDSSVQLITQEFTDDNFWTLLGITSSGVLEVRLACDGSDEYRVQSDVSLPRERWTHVAVTFTGNWVFFFHNGEVVDTASLQKPTRACEPVDHYHLFAGDRSSDTYLADVRLYHSRLTDAEIARQEAAGHLSSPADCGDGIVDEGEACDGQSACCTEDCKLVADGTACGDGGTCTSGVCSSTGQRTPDPDLLYLFETPGDVVLDETAALDLEIFTPGDVGSYSFSDGGLHVEGRVVATAPVAGHLDACKTGGFTIEVTMVDGAPFEEGPPRIVSLSSDPHGSDTSFDVGTVEGRYILRFVGGFSDKYGKPVIFSPQGFAKVDEVTHLVVTVDPEGERVMYVDGVRRAGIRTVAGIEEWSSEVLLALANVGSCTESDKELCRDWEGSLYTVAIYCRPLSELEVGNNFVAESGLGASAR